MTHPNIVLLGTGSPRPCAERCQPAQLLEIGGETFVIDCGDSVTIQIARSGRDVAKVDKIFLTHLHWDHILGYAGLIWAGWSAGRRSIEVWGPVGTKKMHELLFNSLFKGDVDWISNVGYDRSGIDNIRIYEIDEGKVYDREGVTVTATKVKHPVTTFAYRFAYCGKQVVFSGDTAACEELVKCAEGADVLVQDTCAVYSPLYGDEQSRKVRDALIEFHATPAQAGDMATRAGVKRLVCTHLLPGADINEVRAEAESEFIGETIVGYDLQEIRI